MKPELIEKLKKQLKIDEGVITSIYIDSLGYKTFGIGHLITKYDLEHVQTVGSRVSMKRIEEVFNTDVNIAIDNCKKLYPYFDSLPDNIQLVLSNMIFNLGLKKLQKFTKMNNAVRLRDWKTMAREMKNSTWYKQVGARAIRLINLVRTA